MAERAPPFETYGTMNPTETFTSCCTLGESASERWMSDAEFEDGLNSCSELSRVEVVGKSREKFLMQHFTNNGALAIGM